jgi:predicted transcriptional regulator
MHTCGMADTTIRIDEETRDRLKALAAARGVSMSAYLEELSLEEENRQRLAAATASFRAAIARPGFAEAFDHDFGAAPARTTRRAA